MSVGRPRGRRTERRVETEIRSTRTRHDRVVLLAQDGEPAPPGFEAIDRVAFRGEDPRACFGEAAEAVRRLRTDEELAVIAVGLVLQVLSA